MIKSVKTYQTNDGVCHASIEKAKAHIVEYACEAVDNILKPLTQSGAIAFATDRYKIAEALVGDMDKLKNLVNLLTFILEPNEDEVEEEEW